LICIKVTAAARGGGRSSPVGVIEFHIDAGKHLVPSIWRLSWLSKIQFGQLKPVQQHDLTLGWPEEAKNPFAVKV
jgi:hypothetical protein